MSGSEIVVTAQGRTERLQDVPVSVQVLAGQELSTRNVTSLNSVSQIAPSVHMSVTPRGSNLYIRGTGSGQNQSFDQSVGVFIDGVYFGRSRITSAALLDLERVEILKGPQSTFFGNNAIAGAFNIVSKKPGDVFEGWARALASPTGGTNGGQYALEGAVGAPLSDIVGIRLAATYNGQRGWIKNVNTGQRLPNEENLGGRAILRVTPNDDLEVILKAEGSRTRNEGGMQFFMKDCPPPAPFVAGGFCASFLAQGLPLGLDDYRNASGPLGSTKFDVYDFAMTVNYQLGDHQLTSVTGYYNYKFNNILDVDQTPSILLAGSAPEKYDQFSQEFRIASPTGQTIEYYAGLYFQDDKLNSQSSQRVDFQNARISSLRPALIPYLPLTTLVDATQEERVYSAFASVTVNATEQLKISGGLRASWVKKTLDWMLQFGTATDAGGFGPPIPAALQSLGNGLGFGTTGAVQGDRKDNALMPSIKVQYQFNPRVMAYASYSRGFKAGGFNLGDTTGDLTNFPYSPEHVDAYEIGLKSELFDRRLLLNMAIFRSDYKDLQVSVNLSSPFGGAVSLVRNAAAQRAQGVEAEGQLQVTDNFKISTAVTYLESKYRSFPDALPTADQTRRGIISQDLSGHTLAFAPKWAGMVSAAHSLPLGNDHRIESELTGLFRSRYNVNFADDPVHEQSGYLRLDGRLTFAFPGDRWAIDIIGKNLTSRKIALISFTPPGSLGSSNRQIEQPRNVAFQVRFKW